MESWLDSYQSESKGTLWVIYIRTKQVKASQSASMAKTVNQKQCSIARGNAEQYHHQMLERCV